MFYSLKNRFKGCLIGAYLGAKLTENKLIKEDIENIIFLIKILINTGDFTREEIKNLKFNNIYNDYNDLTAKSSAKLAFLLLPMFLFYHDNFALLQEKLQIWKSEFQWSEEIIEDLRLWSKAIALILTVKNKGENILDQILNQENFNNYYLIKQLEIIRNNIEKVGSLQDLIKILSEDNKNKNLSLALVFYYFAYTPEDLSLSVKRALITTDNQDKIIIPLTAALSGIYNSYIGIPAHWRIETKTDKMATEIEGLTEKLFYVWCGVYQIDKNNLSPMTAVAAANVIQPRCLTNHYYHKIL